MGFQHSLSFGLSRTIRQLWDDAKTSAGFNKNIVEDENMAACTVRKHCLSF